jgi:hypothetical protein
MDKIQIILEAVQNATSQLNAAIKQVDDLTSANVRNAQSVQLVKQAIIQQLAAEEQQIQKLYALKAATYDIAQAERMRLAATDDGIKATIGHGGAIGSLTSKLGQNRIAFMELGHVARASAEGLAAGISPSRILALELPRVIQAGAFLGVGLTAVAGFMAALIPLIITGAEAWKTYKAQVQAANSEQDVQNQRLELAGRNWAALDTAYKNGLVSLQEYFRLQKLLSLASEGSDAALRKAQTEMNRLGIAPAGIEAYQQLKKLEREWSEEVMEDFDKRRAKASDTFHKQVEDLDELAKKSRMVREEYDKAYNMIGAVYGQSLKEIGADENKKKAADAIKALEQDITAFTQTSSIDRTNLANREFDFRYRAYKKMVQDGYITEEQLTSLVLEAEKKRQDGLKQEAEEGNKVREKAIKDEMEKLRLIEEQNRALDEQYRATLDIIDSSAKRQNDMTHPRGVNNPGLGAAQSLGMIFDKHLTDRKKALQGHLGDLQNEGGQLQGVKKDMTTAPPGTFSQEDIAKVDQQIADNKRKQVQAAQDIKDAEVAINQQRLQGVSGMFGNMAQVAKAFGKEGFAAYKAFAIAQATIDTARAAIAAYQATVGIPYVGPIIAPIAAGVAVAAGAAQIANIEAQSYATGGMIHGPGSGTSDDVPIMASNREFMVRNAVVEQPGAEGFLRDFNARGMDAIRFGGNTVAGTRTTSTFSGASKEGPRARDRSAGRNLHVGFVNTRNQLRTFMRQDGVKVLIDGLADHGNQVAS